MKPLHELNMRTIPGTSEHIHKRDAAEATAKRRILKKARPVTTPTHDAAPPRVSRRNINNKKKRASENCERLAQRVGDLQSEDEYVRVNFAAIPIRVGV